jgi:hypothetical protein
LENKMSQNIAPHKKKEFISKPLKFVITAASIAGTLGLWGIFSKADVQSTIIQTATDSTLPTVATLVSVDTSSLANITSNTTSGSSSTSVDVLPVVTQPPAVAVATAAPVVIQQPAPVTSSHSSR